jgi:hypothetical protein
LGEFGLVEVGVDVLAEEVVDVLHLGLLLSVDPTDEIVQRSHVVHDEGVLDVELHQRMQLSEDVLAHLHDIFRLDEGTVLQTADYQQENVTPKRLHLYSVYVDSSQLEKAPHVLENVQEN